MFVLTQKAFKMKGSTSKKRLITIFAILSSVVVPSFVNAQEKTNDSALLDTFIQAKGYSSTILFTPSNIKQFWIEKDVISQDDMIKIYLNNKKSSLYKIQLKNVNVSYDCKIDVISNTADLSFSVLNNKTKTISTSTPEEKFINYNIASSSFHLEDTNDYSFLLQFAAESSPQLEIKKIVLSFSSNKSFLKSPGTLNITDSNCTGNGAINSVSEKAFSLTGKRSRIYSNNKLLVSDNTFANSIVIKNIGDQPTSVSVGYIPYTKDGQIITKRQNPYKENKILKVVDVEKENKTIIVDSEPVWRHECYLALNAKEDLSDFPNCSLVDGFITDVKRIDDNHVAIIFDKVFTNDIKIGTPVRVQSPDGALFIYTNTQDLQPGEEVVFTSTIKKDDTYLQFGTKNFCRGTFYVVPAILSYSLDRNIENTIHIKDFRVSY